MSENNIKLTISSDANGAVQQIKILGEAFLGAQKAAGATDTELKLMQAALQAAADEAAKAKAPTDALKDAVHALAMAQKEGADAATIAAAQARVTLEATKRQADEEARAADVKKRLEGAVHGLISSMSGSAGSFMSFIDKLRDTAKDGSKAEAAMVAFTSVIGGLSSVYARVTQAIQTNAGEGQKGSEAIVGAQEHVSDSLDNLITGLTDGLAPAIAGMGSILAEAVDTLGAWLKEGDNATKVSLLMVDGFSGIIQVTHLLVSTVDTLRDSYASLKYALGEMSDKEMKQVADSIKSHAKGFQDLENKIEEMRAKVAAGGTGLGKVMEEEALWGQKGAKVLMEVQGELTAATGKSHAERIAIVERYQEKYAAQLEGNLGLQKKMKNLINAEESAQTKEQIKEHEERGKELAKTDKEALDLRMEVMDEQAELIQEALDEALEAEEEANARSEELAEIKAKREEERSQEAMERAVTQAELEASTAEELAEKLRAAYQSIANDSTLSGKVREQAALKVAAAERKSMADISSAQQKLAADTKKHAAEQQASYDAMAKKIGTTIAGMVNKVIFEHKSLKEAMVETFKQILTQVVSSLTEMATTAIAKAVMTAVGVKAATTVEVAAHTQTMAAAVTSWAGAIPVVGPAIAAGVIASFKTMIMASGQGFESGKASEGRPVGLGNRDPDTPNARVGQDETVLTGAQTRALGGAEAIMAAAQGQGGGQTSSGPQEIALKISFERSGDDLMDFLMKRMTFLVLNKRVRLAASELRA